MTALIIRALGEITNPLPGTPRVPDITSDLYWDLDARSLSLSDGDPVTSWIGTGPAPANNRTLASQQGGWGWPAFSASGGAGGAPALTFNGEQQIRLLTPSATPFGGPYTVVLVCSGESAGSARARFYGGTGAEPTAIYPSTAGVLFVGLSSGGAASAALPSGHFVVAISYNGAESAWGMSGTDAAGLSLPEVGWNGMGFGGNTSSGNPNGGLVGTITRARMYRRAMSVYDIDALVASLEAEYGL